MVCVRLVIARKIAEEETSLPDEMPPAVVDGTRIEASEKEKRYECAR
jgi:hypothetical protein